MIKSILPKLAEVGKIKIGGKGETRKAKSGRDYRLPVKYDYFVITKNSKDNMGNFIIDKIIMSKLGEKPTEIKCSLLYDDIELNFLTSFSYYHGHKCVCRGDGEIAKRLIKDKNNKFSEQEIECNSDCEYLINKKCKPSGLLSVTLDTSQSVGGVYKFRTHSWNSVQNIMSSLALIKNKTGGILAGLKYKLSIVKKATEEHGNVTTVNIEFDGNENELKKTAQLEYQNRKELNIDIKSFENSAKKIGIAYDNDDPEDIQDEYYNEDTIMTAKKKAMQIDTKAFDIPAVIEDKKENKKPVDKKDIEDILL